MSSVGKDAENLVEKYLRNKGYSILERNFRTRAGEIDIISEKDKKIIFIEVKSRIGHAGSAPYEAVRPRKLHHFKRAVDSYLSFNKIKNRKLRFDVVSVILNADHTLDQLKHFENVSFSDIVF